MKDSKYYIKTLNLEQHIEGGYFRQILKSDENYHNRKAYTSIYFLLEHNNCSNFHRLTADEMWYFHDGNPLTIHMIDENGDYTTQKLGLNIENGEQPQFLVPKNTIFGSSVDNGFALVSCVVVPGFEYEDFELFKRDELIQKYPEHKEIIVKLTKS